MNKDEILKAAQSNNKGNEYENKTEIKSNLLSALSALIVGAVLFFLEYWKTKSLNWGIAAIVLTACATQSLYEGIKLRKILWIVIGVVQAVLALLALAAAIFKFAR